MIIPKRFVTKTLPILNKYNILQASKLKPLSKYHRLCLSVIIPHGTTDILLINKNTCFTNYLSTFFFLNFYNTHLKYFFLMLYSLYHIRNDISGPIGIKLIYTLIVHSTWIYFPESSLSYLAWIHSILHYKHVIPHITRLDVFSIICLGICNYFMLHRDDYSEYTHQGFWIPIVIAHIINIG